MMVVPHTRRRRPQTSKQTSKGTTGGACKWRGVGYGDSDRRSDTIATGLEIQPTKS